MLFRERRYERFDYHAPVLFKTERYTMWQAGSIMDISLGGILLKNDKLPVEGELLELRIANLFDGNLMAIKAKVVRHVPPPRGPAVGIEFIVPSSSPELVRVCKILKQNKGISVEAKGRETSSHNRADIIKKARELMDRAQFMDFYQTLEVPKDAPHSEILNRKKELLEVFAVSQQGFQPQELKVLQECLSLIKRLTGILTNPQRRLGYDMAKGSVLYSVVKEAATMYNVDLTPFREFWRNKYAKRVKDAKGHYEQAKAAKKTGDMATYDKELGQARLLDPFSYLD